MGINGQGFGWLWVVLGAFRWGIIKFGMVLCSFGHVLARSTVILGSFGYARTRFRVVLCTSGWVWVVLRWFWVVLCMNGDVSA